MPIITISAGLYPWNLWNRYTDTMHYELWDTASGNLLDDFDTEAEALATIWALMEINNEPNMTADMALLRIDDHPDGGAMIARGADLATVALAARPERERRPV